MFKELNIKKSPEGGAPPSAAVSTPRNEIESTNDEMVSFEIRLDTGNALMKNNKPCTVLVKLKDGVLVIPALGATSTFRHDQVLQLIKSRSKEQRLGVLLAGQGRKEFIFLSMQVCIVLYC